MTHPPGGGHGGGSGGSGGNGTGPGRAYATPLTDEQRTDRYLRQTGGRRLTPRQRRRVDHKQNRAAVRAA
jgi:hypothetical protein